MLEDKNSFSLDDAASDVEKKERDKQNRDRESRFAQARRLAGELAHRIKQLVERLDVDGLQALLDGKGDGVVDQLREEKNDAEARAMAAEAELTQVRSGVKKLTEEKNKNASRVGQLEALLQQNDIPVPAHDDAISASEEADDQAKQDVEPENPPTEHVPAVSAGLLDKVRSIFSEKQSNN